MSWQHFEHSFDDLSTTLLYIRWRRNIFKQNTRLKIKNLISSKYDAYFYCLHFHQNIRPIYNWILSLKDPKISYLFYKNINVPKSKLKKIILSNSKYSLKFALEIDNTYIKYAEKKIIKERNANLCLKLLTSKRHTNQKKLIDIILKEGKPKQLLSLAKMYPKTDLLIKIQKKLMKLNSIKYLTYLMSRFTFLNIDKVENFVKASEMVSDVLFFAKRVKRSKLNELLIFS